MGQRAETSIATGYDQIFQRIQKRVADRLEHPIEIQLWGNQVYRLGKGGPAVKILIEDSHGLTALLRPDELKICAAYLYGNLGLERSR